MNTCPKCSGRMTGPSYRRLGWGGEVLVYRCGCGYSEERACHDAENPRPASMGPHGLNWNCQ